MAALNMKPEDFTYGVFHQPNTKFPQRAASAAGFQARTDHDRLAFPGDRQHLCRRSHHRADRNILDEAKPGDRILMVSFGSGAGSDAFVIKVTKAITERQKLAPLTADYIQRRTEVDYATYVRYRGKLAVK